MACADAGQAWRDGLMFRQEGIDIDDPAAVAILYAIVAQFATDLDLEEAVDVATYSVVEDSAVLDGYSPAFGFLLLNKLVTVVAAGQVCEKAGPDTGQAEAKVDQETRCFAYVAPLIEDSQCIDRGHHRLQSS